MASWFGVEAKEYKFKAEVSLKDFLSNLIYYETRNTEMSFKTFLFVYFSFLPKRSNTLEIAQREGQRPKHLV